MKPKFYYGSFSLLMTVSLTMLLAVPSFSVSENYSWATTPLIIGSVFIFSVVIIFSVIYFDFFNKLKLIFRRKPKILIGSETKAFFQNNLRSLCKRGGYCFSTYLLEVAGESDLVSEQLSKIDSDKTIKPYEKREINYERIIMLDDHSEQQKWIQNFRNICSNINKVSIKPKIHHVLLKNRTFARFIRAIMPRISLTQFQFSDEPLGKTVLLSIGDLVAHSGERHSPRLGISFRSVDIYQKIDKLKNHILTSGNPHLRTLGPDDTFFPTTQSDPLPPFTRRIIYELEELAIGNDFIEHLGLFGSTALLFGLRTSNNIGKHFLGGDVDLIILIHPTADISVIRKTITERLTSLDKTFEIEYSNLDNKFYELRGDYHVDIQLHKSGSDYYMNSSSLLGYSIFRGRYHVIYSHRNLAIDQLLQVPTQPLTQRQRINVYINDRLGLDAFIKRCEISNDFIDPRRITAISLANFVWALTGMWPLSVQDCLKNTALKNVHTVNIDDAHAILEADITQAGEAQQKYMKKSVKLLKEIKDTLTKKT